jgi:5'-nucleotidase
MGYILVTNDDGVDAPGLLALRRALAELGKTVVIAPDRNWSASGHAKTLHRPLRIRETHLRDGARAFSCDGAPSDCVAVALLGFLDARPDLVVSGINPNANVGSDCMYSGTVAAAMEAALVGVPAIAVSLDRSESAFGDSAERAAEIVNQEELPATGGPGEYATAAAFAARLASHVLRENLPSETLLNVNVPVSAQGEAIRGLRITRLGKRIYYDELVKRIDPQGRPYYWIGGEKPGGDVMLDGTDIWALANGMVSITPLHMDMTSHALVDRLAHWAYEVEWGF